MPERAFDRIRVSIIDGAGCGESDDAKSEYPDDVGVNSISNASQVQPLDAPALQSIGIEHIHGLEGMRVIRQKTDRNDVRGAFGSLEPTFKGNGSPEGHQALMGHIVQEPYLLFDRTGFPDEIVALVQRTVSNVLGRQVKVIRYPGTDDVNGVKFINHPAIGPVHLASGTGECPLQIPIYASSDSLIQVALHQGVIPQEQIEAIGKAIREAVDGTKHRIARIIMRPFVGTSEGGFTRVSADRRDYGVDPDEPTLIDRLTAAGIPVHGVGKAASMLNYRGFRHEDIRKLGSDEERMRAIVETLAEKTGIRFDLDNLIGTDELFGHPRKPKEYMDHVAMIDSWIARGFQVMTDRDLWIFTADHGNDPTQKKHTNHTRERVPLLVYSPRMKRPIDLGRRTSFADVAKTVAENYGIADRVQHGQSFLAELL